MGRLVVLMGVGLALVGALLALTLPRGARTARPVGVRLRGDDARFTFRTRDWTHATLLATGDTVPMRDLRVRRVALARPLGDGTTRLDPMTRDEGVWTLRLRDAVAPGESLHFGFVVNTLFWVEPPAAAPHRAPFPGPTIRTGMVAARPSAP